MGVCIADPLWQVPLCDQDHSGEIGVDAETDIVDPGQGGLGLPSKHQGRAEDRQGKSQCLRASHNLPGRGVCRSSQSSISYNYKEFSGHVNDQEGDRRVYHPLADSLEGTEGTERGALRRGVSMFSADAESIETLRCRKSGMWNYILNL